MIRRMLRDESGYSLVEVIVSIMLLSIAIIPMVGMFDAGLQAALTGGNYDKARALANLKLEAAKSLSYAEANNNFPAGATLTSCGSGCRRSGYLSPESAIAANFQGFTYRVEKQFLALPPSNPVGGTVNFSNAGSDTGLMRVTVTVQWDGGTNQISTSGVVSDEQL